MLKSILEKASAKCTAARFPKCSVAGGLHLWVRLWLRPDLPAEERMPLPAFDVFETLGQRFHERFRQEERRHDPDGADAGEHGVHGRQVRGALQFSGFII